MTYNNVNIIYNVIEFVNEFKKELAMERWKTKLASAHIEWVDFKSGKVTLRMTLLKQFDPLVVAQAEDLAEYKKAEKEKCDGIRQRDAPHDGLRHDGALCGGIKRGRTKTTFFRGPTTT